MFRNHQISQTVLLVVNLTKPRRCIEESRSHWRSTNEKNITSENQLHTNKAESYSVNMFMAKNLFKLPSSETSIHFFTPNLYLHIKASILPNYRRPTNTSASVGSFFITKVKNMSRPKFDFVS